MSRCNWGRPVTVPEVLVMGNRFEGFSIRLSIDDAKMLEEVKKRLEGLFTFRSPNR